MKTLSMENILKSLRRRECRMRNAELCARLAELRTTERAFAELCFLGGLNTDERLQKIV